MQRMRGCCDALGCVKHHASERLNRVHIHLPLPFISLVLFFLGCLDIQVNLVLIASAM